MKQLTSKQEQFCQLIADGKNQSEAYRNSYNAEKMKPESITVNASKLLSSTNVSLRVKELRDQLSNKLLWSREDSIHKLKEALETAERTSDVVSVVKELNAMHGYNAPQKVEVAGVMAVTSITRRVID